MHTHMDEMVDIPLRLDSIISPDGVCIEQCFFKLGNFKTYGL